MAKQLRLGFPEKALGFDDLCISESNASALSVIRGVARWPSSTICLLGPPQSGLTTATIAWAKENDASLITPSDFDALEPGALGELAGSHTAIDNAEQIKNKDHLLSLINLSSAKGTCVLLASGLSPANWPTDGNADLRSRLESAPIAAFDEPDEILLTARLISACKQRYLKLPLNAAEYLAKRMEKSFVAIEDIADRLNAAVSKPDTKLTINTARDVLNDGLGSHPLFDIDTD